MSKMEIDVDRAAEDGDAEMVASCPQRLAKRGRDGDARDWTVYIPKGRTSSMCFTCGGPILPRTARVRLGARNSRYHHISCTDLDAESIRNCSGWAELSVEVQTTVIATLQAGMSATHTSLQHELAALPATDEAMISATLEEVTGEMPTALQHMDFWQSINFSSLHDPVQTGRSVPPQVHFAVTEFRHAVAQYILDARDHQDKASEILGYKLLFFSDRLLFATPSKHRGGQRGQSSESLTKMIIRRLRSAWAGEWSALWQEANRACRVPGTGSKMSEAQMVAADIREIELSIQDGDDRAALKRVDGPMTMAPPDVACRELPALFPRPTQPLPPEVETQPDIDDVAAFMRTIDSVFLGAPKKRGPGPGGARNEHWYFSPHFEDLWAPLRLCWLDLALGKVPAEVMQAAACARVLAGAKDDGKVRPFALGIVIRRLISRCVAKIFRARVSASLGTMQYGSGRPSGAEEMHKTVMTDLAARQAACLNSFDISNAHNEMERAVMITAVRERVPALGPWIEPWLRTYTTHVCTLPGAAPLALTKDRGGDQGDPLINALFPLAFQHILIATEQAARTIDDKANIYAYQDDADLVCTAAARAPARAAFSSGCAAAGLRINCQKETIYFGPSSDRSINVECKVVDRPLVLRHGDECPIPVVHSSDNFSESVSAEAAAMVGKRLSFVAKLKKLQRCGLPIQLCLRLLRARTSGDFTFLARTCGISPECSKHLDNIIVEFVQHLAGSDGWNDGTSRRCFHPFAEGGLGLISAEFTAPCALAGSWNAVVRRVADRLGYASVETMQAQVAAIAARIHNAQAIVYDLLPSTGEETWDCHSQRALSRARKQDEVNKFSASIGDDFLSSGVRLSSGGPGAAAWLYCPRKPKHYFTDEQFAVSLRARLDMHQCVGPTAKCQHKKSNGQVCGRPLDRRGTHAMCCGCGGWTGRRHDEVNQSLVEFAEKNRGHSVKECILPYASPSLPEARLDAIIRSATSAGRQIIDVTVVTPLSQEMLRHGTASRVPGAAATAAASHKRRKYPNIDVIPFVIEHFGRWGEDALAFAKSLAPPPESGRSEVLSEFYQDVACAVQRSNADAILSSIGR